MFATYRDDVYRRVIQVLLTIAPDAPIPIAMVTAVVENDSLIGGPYTVVIDNLALAPKSTSAVLERLALDGLIQLDQQQGSVLVSTDTREALQGQYVQLPTTPQAREREEFGTGEPAFDLLVEMYDAASVYPDLDESDYTTAELRLMVPHLVQITDVVLAAPPEDWGTAQLLTTLWLLASHEVVPDPLLATLTARLVAACEQRHSDWYEWSAGQMLWQAAEEMADAQRPDLAPTIVHLLDMARAVYLRVPKNDRGTALSKIQLESCRNRRGFRVRQDDA